MAVNVLRQKCTKCYTAA